jgi:hypothetical protein
MAWRKGCPPVVDYAMAPPIEEEPDFKYTHILNNIAEL